MCISKLRRLSNALYIYLKFTSLLDILFYSSQHILEYNNKYKQIKSNFFIFENICHR